MMVILDKYLQQRRIKDPRWEDLNKLKDLI